MRTIKFTEILHQWQGVAIVRTEEGLKEESLGIVQTDKKLKETGAKDLFDAVKPANTIAIEVTKIADVLTVYSADVEEFKKIAKTGDINESAPENLNTPSPEQDQEPKAE